VKDAERNEMALFGEALEYASRQEQAAYVAGVCGDDPALRARVEALLAAHHQGGDFLRGDKSTDTVAHALRAEGPGTTIGPFKLLEQIGEGGFGVVFMAEQHQPVRRKVALKLVKPGMDTRQVIARFEAEQQALALMDHPNIAHVFDGGVTPTGRPFFVMELVRGVPITEFCDRNHVPVRERLELFISVCQAVQHAHQKGIIHRDLKPNNVLVTMHDDRAVVKVIDFGIAKAIGQQLTEKTLFTNFAQMIGTPIYMSPEQAQMSGLDVDTRSDIYWLGVLLYELLTGMTPLDGERLRTAGFDEIRRIIREEDPPRPSTRISTLGQAGDTVAANRRSNAAQLSTLLRSELDWIVMKALEKDRNRRYETASAFSADVQRYLADDPVQACPPSVGYRVRKFARRNRGPVLATAVAFLLLLGGVVGTTLGMVQARQAEQEAQNARERIERERDAAVEARKETFDALIDLTDFSSQHLYLDRLVWAPKEREFLERMAVLYERLASLLPDAAGAQGTRALSLSQAGHTYVQLGDVDRGVDAWRRAVDVHRRLPPAKSADTAVARSESQANARRCRAVALAAEKLRQWPEAIEFARLQLAFARAALVAGQRPDLDLFNLLLTGNWSLTVSLTATGQFDDALAAWEEMVRLVAWSEPGGLNFGACEHLCRIATKLTAAGKVADATAILAPGMAERHAELTTNPGAATARIDLRRAYRGLGLIHERARRFEVALDAFDSAIAVNDPPPGGQGFPVNHERDLQCGAMIGRAICLDALGRETDAEAAWKAMYRYSGASAANWSGPRAMHLAHNGQPERAVRLAEETWLWPGREQHYNAACAYATASADTSLSPRRKEELARRAVVLLEAARTNGFFNDPARVAHARDDADLNPVRGRDDFKNLMATLEAGKNREK
jgi:serine/threonine protein kinase/tetratricopeptide (TPR) repeat protein